MVTGAAPAGRGATARTREAAAAHGVDTGETADGERAQLAQGEGLSADISACCQSVICCVSHPAHVCFLPADSCVGAGGGA